MKKILLLFAFFSVYAECDFITGNKFKALCRYSYDEYGFNINDEVKNNYWFVKTDLLDQFFLHYMPKKKFVLISHNADHGVKKKYLFFLQMPKLIRWYGQNVETRDPKLTSIPIGLCNFADHDAVKRMQKMDFPKSKLVYANYDLGTNFKERRACLEKTGVPLAPRKSFELYLEDVARSYFVISPDGNGVDTHRTWEALYLKAIPIVTKTINAEFYSHLPIILLDTWDDFRNLELSMELYEQIWGDFDPATLNVSNMLTGSEL